MFIDWIKSWGAPKVAPASRFADVDAVDADDAALAAAGRRAVVEAERLFNLDVVDPSATDESDRARRDREAIAAIIARAGWGFALPYLGNRRGATQWCGMFAAACWRNAGIDPSMLASFWASTVRLHTWARYKTFNGKANPPPKRGARRLMCDLRKSKTLAFEPRAGDILVIGDGTPVTGDHICVVVSYDADRGVFHTIEGNGVGLGPDGKKREGIVRGERSISSAMFLYRPAPADLIDP